MTSEQYQPYPGTQYWPPPGHDGLSPTRTGQPLVQIGDITVTQDEVVTPSGRIPLGQAQLMFTDGSMTSQVTPGWAVVLAVLGFFFFLLGLLFLLVKEERTTGFVTVTVTGPGFMHACRMPAFSRAQVNDVLARVNHANGLAQSRRW